MRSRNSSTWSPVMDLTPPVRWTSPKRSVSAGLAPGLGDLAALDEGAELDTGQVVVLDQEELHPVGEGLADHGRVIDVVELRV